jgi:hypothetical protein
MSRLDSAFDRFNQAQPRTQVEHWAGTDGRHRCEDVMMSHPTCQVWSAPDRVRVPGLKPSVQVSLLNGFALHLEGRELYLNSRKARALLAYLVLTPGMKDTRNRLVGLLWGETAEAKARSSLRQVIHQLRETFVPEGLPAPIADKVHVGLHSTALVTDLGSRMADTVVLTMSEFGRAVRENGNRGTDHGHGNAMMVIGGGVKGGHVYGKWPGLEEHQLNEGRDLALTTDFRSVVGEVLTRHIGVKDLAPVFPGFDNNPHKFPGLVRA